MSKKSPRIEADLRLVVQREDGVMQLSDFLRFERDRRGRPELKYGSGAEGAFRFTYHGSGIHNLHHNASGHNDRESRVELRKVRGFAEQVANGGHVFDLPWDYGPLKPDSDTRRTCVIPLIEVINGLSTHVWVVGVDRCDLVAGIAQGRAAPPGMVIVRTMITMTDPVVILAAYTLDPVRAPQLRAQMPDLKDGEPLGALVYVDQQSGPRRIR